MGVKIGSSAIAIVGVKIWSSAIVGVKIGSRAIVGVKIWSSQ